MGPLLCIWRSGHSLVIKHRPAGIRGPARHDLLRCRPARQHTQFKDEQISRAAFAGDRKHRRSGDRIERTWCSARGGVNWAVGEKPRDASQECPWPASFLTAFAMVRCNRGVGGIRGRIWCPNRWACPEPRLAETGLALQFHTGSSCFKRSQPV